MNEAKFTPGPWKKTQNEVSIASIGVVYHGDGKTWFDIGAVNFNYDTFLEQQPYNTDLIVASPDLYTALDEIVNYTGEADSPLEDKFLMERVNAALSKARGE